MAHRVLFIESVHDILRQRLADAGFDCVLDHSIPRERILAEIGQYTGLVLRSRIKVDRELIDTAHGLQFIARSGSGLENIDVAYAESKGIRIVNSPEGNRDAVGEHALAMLLMLFNKLKQADAEVRKGIWRREENRGLELAGKVVGIIGYGQMGSSFAKKLSGFDAEVIAHDKYLDGFPDHWARPASLEEVHQRADIVSLHLPLTPETMGYANDDFFAAFRKPIWFINTARGKHLDTAALARAMQSGKVLGACLDVLEYEKASLEGLEFANLPEALRYLYANDQVVFSPHVAGWTIESYEKLSSVLADKILEWWPTVTG